MPRNPPWEPEELILALDLYLQIGKSDDKDPQVIALSETLNRMRLDIARPDPSRFRNPNGVAMKLANFAALDPTNPVLCYPQTGGAPSQQARTRGRRVSTCPSRMCAPLGAPGRLDRDLFTVLYYRRGGTHHTRRRRVG